MKQPQTLKEAIGYFASPDTCFEYVVNLRWSDGVVTCPHCHSEFVSFVKTRRIWNCLKCKKQFSIKTGTIFQDSPIALDKWLCAMWLIANAKNGVSSCEIARAIGVTQKTAWFMAQTYIHVDVEHLFRYLDEQTFRYDHRKRTDFWVLWK